MIFPCYFLSVCLPVLWAVAGLSDEPRDAGGAQPKGALGLGRLGTLLARPSVRRLRRYCGLSAVSFAHYSDVGILDYARKVLEIEMK